MSENCNHNCDTCSENCNEKKPQSFLFDMNTSSNIKNVYAIMSGKGGVGKSMVTSMLSILSQKSGAKTAILDADITGPSIPKTFGLKENASGTADGILPEMTKSGIKIMSTNLLLENETEPVIWRGPVVVGVIKQFWSDVIWGDVDNMYVDMPPGTGDVPLTVFQSLPIKGIIIVTSPQELVSMIVEKAVNMAEKMNIPILGIVENMSYFECSDCHKKHYIFGQSKIEEVAKKYNIKNIVKLPINPEIAQLSDGGLLEDIDENKISDLKKFI